MLWTRVLRRSGMLMLGISALVGCAACSVNAPAVYMTHAAVEQSDEFQKITSLNATADQMYKNVYAAESFEDVLAIRQQLQKFSKTMTQIKYTGITSPEGARAFYDTVLEAQKEFNAVQYSQEEASEAIARVRLVTDALTHPSQPMWLQYYRTIHEEVNVLETTVKDAKWADALSSFNILKTHYLFIRPAMLIQRPPEEEERVLGTLRFIEEELSRPQISKRQVQIGIENFRLMLSDLFAKKDAAAYGPALAPPNPWIWSSVLGASILTVLVYVAYLRYRHEQNYVPVQKEKRGKVY
ncbi:hypothetical protein SY83_18460 [Paenibacillus swuensis]|uniref:Sporulation protein n=1 Tax=Paenibacillus swuensis TaxID=1178515 RepID=A0A172TLK6_9BACL|nr:sporulation protein YpjB [Paenibacillus swuensis]ANE47949.1 hypothetical protein SY83_18460 [Paenibacillus swuensis]